MKIVYEETQVLGRGDGFLLLTHYLMSHCDCLWVELWVFHILVMYPLHECFYIIS